MWNCEDISPGYLGSLSKPPAHSLVDLRVSSAFVLDPLLDGSAC